MALDGFVFDKRNITSAAWAHYNWIMTGKQDGLTSGCDMTVSGNDVNIADGYFFIRGRMGIVSGTTTVTAPTVASGTAYCTLVAQIDLTKVNTTDEMKQLTFEVLTSASTYPSVTQEDLDNGGNIYQVAFAHFDVTANGISNFTPVIGEVDTDYIHADQFSYVSGTNSLYLTL